LQHRTLNDFLNAKVQETHPQNPGAQSQRRVPIEYRHRRETDKFFELPPSYWTTLPPALKAQLNARHAVKVRVSHDQKTGEVLAKIIKARIADLDIHNPQSPLDCRISINFEMRYDGDIEELKAIVPDQRIPDRNKDRLSYSQSYYQIDLTQVTQLVSVNVSPPPFFCLVSPSNTSQGVNKTEREHELEIELATAAVREQGQRAVAGQPNEYVALVEAFVDNVRLLARAVS
jgi:polynucleotide 5'-triphosphatase